MIRREFIAAPRQCGGVASSGARTTTGKIAPYWRTGVCVASPPVR